MGVTILPLGLLVIGGSLWWVWSKASGSLVTRGTLAYERKDWLEAGRLAQERLETSKADTKARRLLARTSARLGRFPEAKAIYASLEIRDLEAEDYCLQGLGQSLAGDPLSAQSALKKALELDPDHAESLHLLGLAAYQMGRVVESTKLAEQLVRKPGWESRAEFLLGVSRASDHDASGASEALRRALRHDPEIRAVPDDPLSTQKLLARVLMQSGQGAEARDVLLEGRRSSVDTEAEWLLSRAYLMLGDVGRAAEALKRSGSYRAEHLSDPEPAAFVGEARCTSCHPVVGRTVLASRHSRTYLAGEIAGLPVPDQPVPDPHNPRVSHEIKRSNGEVVVLTRLPDRILRAVVEYALGAPDRFSSLVARDESGQWRNVRLAYHHGPTGSGWSKMKGLEPLPRRDDDYLGETYSSEDARRECLVCHVTSPRAVREQVGPEAADKAIGCERCHGPGSLHLAALPLRFPDMAISLPSRSSPAEVNRSCAECHAQHYLAMPASFTDPAWARFPSSSLPMSACFTRSGGALDCVTCHDPHRDVETSPSHYEEKCLTCHASRPGHQDDAAFRPSCPVNPRRDCLKCHMPKVPYDWLHGHFTDHYIRIPSESDHGR